METKTKPESKEPLSMQLARQQSELFEADQLAKMKEKSLKLYKRDPAKSLKKNKSSLLPEIKKSAEAKDLTLQMTDRTKNATVTTKDQTIRTMP
jgi:hypothetical protein